MTSRTTTALAAFTFLAALPAHAQISYYDSRAGVLFTPPTLAAPDYGLPSYPSYGLTTCCEVSMPFHSDPPTYYRSTLPDPPAPYDYGYERR